MAQQTGAQAYISIAEEGTFGTVVTSGFKLPFISSSLSADIALNDSAVLNGNANPTEPFQGNTNVSGDIVVPLDNEALWYWLQLMFGDPTTADADPLFTHVFKITTAQPSFSHQKSFTELATDKFLLAVGCKVTSMTIEFGGDGELTLSMSVVGSNETIAASTAFSVAEPTVVQTEKYSNLNCSIKEGGGASTIVKSFSLTVDFNIDTDQRIIAAGGILGSLPKGKAKISGNVKTMFTDTVILDKARAKTESSLELTIANPTTAGHTLIIDINELLYSFKSPPIDGPQGLDVDLDYMGYYTNDVGESGVIITLANATEHA